jgi:hypothetical protein
LDKLQRLKNRAIYSTQNNLGWDGVVWLEQSIIGELKHWLNQFRKCVSYRLIKPIPPQAVITTDASPSGWGASLTDAKTSKILSQSFGSWTPQMNATRSNKWELVAVHKAIETFLPALKTNQWSSLKIMTGNTTTAYNINRNAAHNLVPSTRKLLVMASKNGFQVKADYIPGVENGTADSLSRLETAGDYSIQPKKFRNGLRYLQTTFGVDLFANKFNHLLSVYGSLKKDPKDLNSLGNALDVDWTNMCPFLQYP